MHAPEEPGKSLFFQRNLMFISLETGDYFPGHDYEGGTGPNGTHGHGSGIGATGYPVMNLV